jgi:hypothetical protein
MHHGAAETRARQERFPATNREGRFKTMVAKGHRLSRVVLHHCFANIEAQLVVDCGTLKFRHSEAGFASFEAHHLVACGGQFLGDYAADHTHADDDDVDFLQLLCHGGFLSVVNGSGATYKLAGIFGSG